MNPKIIKHLISVTDEEKAFLGGELQIDCNLYMLGNNNIINSKKLLSEGKLITVRPHTRFVHFPEHSHDYVEVVYMCEGQTVHIINGEQVVLKKGELLFLSQNAKQEILPAGEKDIAVNFVVLPEFFDQSLLMIGDDETPIKKFIISCLKSRSFDMPYLHFEVADILPIQNLVEILVWILINNAPNKRKINQTTMGLLFLQLMNYTDRLTYNNRQDGIVLQILRYIEEHYVNGSLKELSEILHYDFSWLSREIKKKTGKTYTELVQEKRMSQASFLLKNTDLNVDDIAIDVGYNNMSYFHELFRKHYLVSPSKYRKEYLKNSITS